jgi:hypothetical protein
VFRNAKKIICVLLSIKVHCYFAFSGILVGSMAHRRGVEYVTSFKFLKQQRNLNLSTSVANLKEFFSTTKAHTNKSFLSK